MYSKVNTARFATDGIDSNAVTKDTTHRDEAIDDANTNNNTSSFKRDQLTGMFRPGFGGNGISQAVFRLKN